jgi:hypothetical protein
LNDTKIIAWGKVAKLFSVIRGGTMQSTEPRIIKRAAATFYELMRQIYVEQVWRQNEQSGTDPAGDRRKTELHHNRAESPKLAPRAA